LLSGQGHDAVTVRQQTLNGRPDVEVAAACKSERRALERPIVVRGGRAVVGRSPETVREIL
jgi:arsenate reductase-like glutaredoxin family protein